MSATNWHLASTSTRIKSYAAAASDFQQSLKGVHCGELRHSGLWEKLAEQVFRKILSGADFMSPSLVSPGN